MDRSSVIPKLNISSVACFTQLCSPAVLAGGRNLDHAGNLQCYGTGAKHAVNK